MAGLDQYANKYQHVRMERQNGILQITLHSDGGSLQWGAGPHRELPQASRIPQIASQGADLFPGKLGLRNL